MDDTVVLERLLQDGQNYYRIQVRRDPDPESPRGLENPALLLTWESKYSSPDGRDGATATLTQALDKWKVANDFLRPVRARLIIIYLRAFAGDEIYAAAALQRSPGGELLPDFEPDSDGWYDGLALVPAERWQACMGDTPPATGLDVETADGSRHVPSAVEALRQEIDTYNAYLRGEVYGYVVERAVLGGWEPVASLWGMMGELEEYVLAEARAALPESAVEVDQLPGLA